MQKMGEAEEAKGPVAEIKEQANDGQDYLINSESDSEEGEQLRID